MACSWQRFILLQVEEKRNGKSRGGTQSHRKILNCIREMIREVGNGVESMDVAEADLGLDVFYSFPKCVGEPGDHCVLVNHETVAVS